MNIFLDTSSKDFVLVLFDDNFKVIDSILLTGYKKKVDLIPIKFEQILKNNNLDTQDIKSFYTNLGPGFFTGIRASLVFFRTIAMLLKKEIWTTNTLEILKTQNPNQEMFYLDAQGNKVYQMNVLEYQQTNDIYQAINVCENNDYSLNFVDYQNMIDNFFKYKNIFKKEDKLLDIEPFYIKKPQIGG
ncbi:tRNA (adenosine(37)-N6)-threonylcarbamoyltransferase complex dimerization subunit type 1 TsaB [Mycoplasma leonicaptivi]|uniref:tRNA (adenosine(37)-N6)-threonylcarbamoyltransferase complex dimerization subunit type 1 TsaB n=1 Tax=Mycoplasma leonicaptivi TaxID=36742 RepID=UPI00047F7868|nr:tRNA (adenosine(37)-N6)-threonylcarbamoyltransferase complex dimerization subunit type 1 TsaB [Mycoplasma leonicaptivi]